MRPHSPPLSRYYVNKGHRLLDQEMKWETRTISIPFNNIESCKMISQRLLNDSSRAELAAAEA